MSLERETFTRKLSNEVPLQQARGSTLFSVKNSTLQAAKKLLRTLRAPIGLTYARNNAFMFAPTGFDTLVPTDCIERSKNRC